MGGSWSSGRGVKRPHEEEQAETSGETSDSEGSDLNTPKRKRIQSTSKYIVKTLFEEGVDSDVTIQTLGKKWRLHKLYLSQCKYFDSMFNGPWMESDQSDITMEISDENIDREALKIALKSLYTDNVFVKPVQAVGVLAAATLLQLDPLVEHCKTVMKGCITSKTVCTFFAASERYGLVDVKDHCRTWLLHCLMAPNNAPMLSDISEELLGSVLDDKDLWLLQVEIDVYTLLKKWVFLQMEPSWSGNGEQLHRESNDFFRCRYQFIPCCFLETEDGRCFIRIFEKVRWMYVINDLSSIQLLKDDHIVPISWLDPFFKFCWFNHLRTEQGVDTGPHEVNEDDFYKNAMRCGRVLIQEQEYHWRWLGYQYGLDLLFTLRNKVLSVKRNSGSQQNFEGSLSQQKSRRMMVCVKVAQIKKKELCTNTTVKSTGIKTVPLIADDIEFFLLALDQNTKFPLQVTMHLLYVNPSAPMPSLAVPPPPVGVVPSQSLAAGSPSSIAMGSIGNGDGETESPGGGRQSQKGQSTQTEATMRGTGEPSGASSQDSDAASGAGCSCLGSRVPVGVVSSLQAPQLFGSSSSLASSTSVSSTSVGEDVSRVAHGCEPGGSADRPPAVSFSTDHSPSSSSSSATVSSVTLSAMALASGAYSSAILPSVRVTSPANSVTVSSLPPSFALPSSSSSSTSLARSATNQNASSTQPSSSAPESTSSSPSQQTLGQPGMGGRTARVRSRMRQSLS